MKQVMYIKHNFSIAEKRASETRLYEREAVATHAKGSSLPQGCDQLIGHHILQHMCWLACGNLLVKGMADCQV